MRSTGWELSALAATLGQVVVLKMPDVSDNKLSTVPEMLGQLVALERLNVFGNQLSTFPESLGQMRARGLMIIQQNCL